VQHPNGEEKKKGKRTTKQGPKEKDKKEEQTSPLCSQAMKGGGRANCRVASVTGEGKDTLTF